jgi:competence protein ComEA
MSISQSDRVRWLVTAAIVVLVVSILLTSFSKSNTVADATLLVKADAQGTPPDQATSVKSPTATTTAQIGVDIIGAVQQPGVYYLDNPARIVDAVQAAHGFAPDADRERINLAAHITDGQQIRVPRVGDTMQETNAVDSSTRSSTQGAGLNINQADAAMLGDLPGIGPSIAEAIVAHRTSSGPFKRVEDIQNVKGIGPALFSKIKDHITVDP